MAPFVLAALESVLPHIVLHHMSSASDEEKDCQITIIPSIFSLINSVLICPSPYAPLCLCAMTKIPQLFFSNHSYAKWKCLIN
ncbi:hypothetical protein VIGAN_09100200 [Vigna angularis var. angularis]|uniref:Uncharacterized protein n=1 Tax=Vigna angularis var. angularis TaxID=157739 RepID=A0A0S3SXE6_PHAAN|nr:hypothetical protein VIGAN_09100200 [Vigna angularis var. angularis]